LQGTSAEQVAFAILLEDHMKKAFGLLVGLALVACLATGEAWGRGGGGGGGGHGGGGGGGHAGGGFYGLGLGYGLGYGIGGYGGYGGGYYGGSPYYGGYDYSYPAYSYPPSYAPSYPPMGIPAYSTVPAYTNYDSYYYSPTPAPSNPGYYVNNNPQAQTVQVAAKAPVQLEVLVPDSQARVWVDGKLTSSTGGDRIYTTAPLETGYTYAYNVRVEWNRGGHEVAVERQVKVVPGRLNKVDFTKDVNQPGVTSSVP
jgi:uncharacterized protein (TIGR03000 family)